MWKLEIMVDLKPADLYFKTHQLAQDFIAVSSLKAYVLTREEQE